MVRRYVPEAGDIVWLHFDPQAGHSAGTGRQPFGLQRQDRADVCRPMTTQVKGYPFEVLIAGDRPGAALADRCQEP